MKCGDCSSGGHVKTESAGNIFKATCRPPDEAEQQRGAHKGPAPHMDVLYRGHAQEDEDEGFTHAAPHLQEILDAGVAALGNIRLHILLHGHGAGHNAAERGRDQIFTKLKGGP